MKAGQTFRFKCRRPLQGRYVVIWKEGTKTPLTLCEVEVYGGVSSSAVAQPKKNLKEKKKAKGKDFCFCKK
jgi:hypothetical protein